MIKDIDKNPCVLEYSEEQKCWHINNGGNELCSNGYEPLAMGSYVSIINLKKLIDVRGDTDVATLSDARQLVWDVIWDHAKILRDVRYCVPLKEKL